MADCCTTTELARRLSISPAGASQHATVLRQANLITSRRHRNTVHHSLTPLGIRPLQKLQKRGLNRRPTLPKP
ncbi:ArsR/SmtB family transcription factor [Embleya sp. NPDC050154]|uniref:ArsR/SmtB family transcription factor n=1 Tax=Embleya sp. NPDC050154 TaxID=3363988 RepID=UPI0037B955EC